MIEGDSGERAEPSHDRLVEGSEGDQGIGMSGDARIATWLNTYGSGLYACALKKSKPVPEGKHQSVHRGYGLESHLHVGWGWNAGIGGAPSWNYSELSLSTKRTTTQMRIPVKSPSREGSFGSIRMPWR